MSGFKLSNDMDTAVGYSIIDDMDVPLLSPPETDHFEQKKTNCLYKQKDYGGDQPVDVEVAKKTKKRLIMATSLCFAFMIAELVGGYMAGSLAIMTDAAHLMSDCISFIVALTAIWFARQPADDKMSFGYKRIEILGAVISIFIIWLLTSFLCYFAAVRLISEDFQIDADTMMIVSSIGVAINIVMGVILHGGCDLPHGHGHSHGHTHTQHSHHHHSASHHSHTNGHVPSSFAVVERRDSSVLHRPSLNGSTLLSVANQAHIRNNSLGNIAEFTTSGQSPVMRRKSIDSAAFRAAHSSGDEATLALCGGGVGGGGAPNVLVVSTGNAHNMTVHRGSVDSNDSCEDHASAAKNAEANNINMRAAVIHVLGDFIQSVGVFVAALIIKFYPSAKMADPLCTFVFSLIVFMTTIRIIRETINVLLDAVPSSVPLNKLKNELICIDGVRSAHQLNVWAITSDWIVMSVHLVVKYDANYEEVLEAATTIAEKGFHIRNATIQIEKEGILNGLANGTIN